VSCKKQWRENGRTGEREIGNSHDFFSEGEFCKLQTDISELLVASVTTMSNKRKAPKSGSESPEIKEEEDESEVADETQDASLKRKGDDSKKSKTVWSATEDDALLKAVVEDQQDREAEGDGEEEEDWDEIAKVVPGKTPVQCLKRYILLNRKQASAPTEPSSPAAESVKEEEEEEQDEEEDEDSPVSKKTKRVKKDTETSGSKWSTDEIELLKKLVEQYKDSKYSHAHKRSAGLDGACCSHFDLLLCSQHSRTTME
jgi:hypothetical protein